jgi:transposase
MPRAYSEDLRLRLIRDMEAGASARSAAARFGVSPSTAVKVMQRWRRTGQAAGGNPGGDHSSKLVAHAPLVRELVAAEPDLTLEEMRARLAQRGIVVGRGTVWRFLTKQQLTRKKNSARHAARPT